MNNIIFEGKKSGGVIDFDKLAKTDDHEKFIVRARVAIRLKSEFIDNSDDIKKQFNREACIQLKELVNEFEKEFK